MVLSRELSSHIPSTVRSIARENRSLILLSVGLNLGQVESLLCTERFVRQRERQQRHGQYEKKIR